MTRIERVVVVAVVVLAGVSSALAQESSFPAVANAVQSGETIYVTDASGATWRGKLLTASPAAISIRALITGPRGQDTTRDMQWAASDVTSVEREKRDSLANGALIGGLAGGAAAIAMFSRSSGCDCTMGDVALLVVAPVVGGGIAFGALIDSGITSKTTVFRRGGSGGATVRFAPLLAPSVRGGRVSITF